MSQMKKFAVILSLLVFLSFPSFSASPVQATLDSIVGSCLPKGTDAAIMVYDITAGQPVYALREDVMCRPASVQKVITSIVALNGLGADFQFETRLEMRGELKQDGTLDGDIYLVGGLDPALASSELRKMAQDLKKAGVNRIAGTLYADVSMMDSIPWGPGWSWDDAPSSYQPFISALMVDEGSLRVQVVPTRNGQKSDVFLFPANRFIKVVNNSVSNVKSAGPLSMDYDWLHDGHTVRIAGNVTKAQSLSFGVRSSQDFAFSLFREYLDEAGVSYSEFAYGKCPTVTSSVSVVSHPLTQIMKQALKESDNLYAECMFLRSAYNSTGSMTGFTQAAQYLRQFVDRKFGFDSHNFNVVDGSGLSMYDFVTPRLLTDLLALIMKDVRNFDIFYTSLPISGVDGTLKTRMSDKSSIGKIHAKTGSVTGACTLAGYVRNKSGHLLAFAIMNSGAVKMAPSRKFQDAFCVALSQL